MSMFWPLKLCEISSDLYGTAMLDDDLCPPAHFALPYSEKENLQTSEAYVSKPFDLNDIKFVIIHQKHGCLIDRQFQLWF